MRPIETEQLIAPNGLGIRLLAFHSRCDDACLYENPRHTSTAAVAIEAVVLIENVSGRDDRYFVPCDLRWAELVERNGTLEPSGTIEWGTAWKPGGERGVDLSNAGIDHADEDGWIKCPFSSDGWFEPKAKFAQGGRMAIRTRSQLGDGNRGREHVFWLRYGEDEDFGFYVTANPSPS